MLKKIMGFFKKETVCDCPWANNEDDLSGKLFKHHRNGKLYRYLFAASPESNRSELVVVYQDEKSKLIYTRPWNAFFGTTGKTGERIPRFEEQI